MGLEDAFTVVLIERVDPARVKAVIAVTVREDACRGVRGLSSRINERPMIAVKDLKVSG